MLTFHVPLWAPQCAPVGLRLLTYGKGKSPRSALRSCSFPGLYRLDGGLGFLCGAECFVVIPLKVGTFVVTFGTALPRGWLRLKLLPVELARFCLVTTTT